MRRDHLGIQDRRELESRAAMEGSRKEADSREGGREQTGEREREREEQITRVLAYACVSSSILTTCIEHYS